MAESSYSQVFQPEIPYNPRLSQLCDFTMTPKVISPQINQTQEIGNNNKIQQKLLYTEWNQVIEYFTKYFVPLSITIC